MHVRRFRVAVLTVAATLLSSQLSPPAAAAGSGGAWVPAAAVPLPDSAADAVLRDVSVLGPQDVWAVGAWSSVVAPHTFAVHWNGKTWTVLQPPDDPSYTLGAVDAVTATDVWAAGAAGPEPLLTHYDGGSWSAVAAPPALAGSRSQLSDVDLRTAGDGWAVGDSAAGLVPPQPLILRYQGGQWFPVGAPVVAGSGRLTSVVAVSPDEAWAVGSQQHGGVQAPLVAHWDGTAWTEVTVPGAGPADVTLSSVAGSAADGVWAAGSSCQTSQPGRCDTVVLRRAEGTWQLVPSATGAVLTEVVPLAPADVWVFGQTPAGRDHIQHWNGQRFIDGGVPPVVVNGQPGSAMSLAGAAADRATGTLWAVGWVQANANGLRAPHVILRG